jgi:hypothetical protein
MGLDGFFMDLPFKFALVRRYVSRCNQCNIHANKIVSPIILYQPEITTDILNTGSFVFQICMQKRQNLPPSNGYTGLTDFTVNNSFSETTTFFPVLFAR